MSLQSAETFRTDPSGLHALLGEWSGGDCGDQVLSPCVQVRCWLPALLMI